MGTYRERRMARAERLREWAEKRETKATAALNSYPTIRRDWAFITQPGHIPLRAKMNAADDRAHESLKVAGGMKSRAAGIEDAAERAIYDDDPDAVERLEEKAATLEAKRERMKTVNKLYRNAAAETRSEADRADAVKELAELGVDFERMHARLTEPGVLSWHKVPYPAYELSNLGGVIRTARKRVEEVKARRERDRATEEAGGFRIERTADGAWCSVRFSEKPDRAILEALKGAGFRWSGGGWMGPTEKLPAAVLAMETETKEESGC